MSAPLHRASKAISTRKATTVAMVGFTAAGTVALTPGTGHAMTLQQAKAQYQADEAASEAAGQVYDGQEQAYATLQQKIDTLQSTISTQNEQVVQMDASIGAQAAQQYRGGGMSASLQLALSASPSTYLDQVTGQSQVTAEEAVQLRTVQRYQAELRQEQALAANLLTQQQAALKAAQAAMQQSNAAAAAAKELVESLTPAEQVEVSMGDNVDGAWTHYTGSLPTITDPRAAAAVQFAEAQLGKPYVMGTDGPDTFDCSGLTRAAWAAAGISIGHNSYIQWDTLPHIPVSQVQPGDLLFFFPSSMGPGHVAIYVGDGMYIEATHTGSYIEWASLNPSSFYYGNMPLVGAARVPH